MATYYQKAELGTPEDAANRKIQERIGQLTSNPGKRDITINPGEVFSGKMSLEDFEAHVGGSPDFNPNIGPQIDYGQGKQNLSPAQLGALAQGKSIQDAAQIGAPVNASQQAYNANVAQQNEATQQSYRKAYEQVKATGAPPKTIGEATNLVQSALPPTQVPGIADTLFQTDPYFQTLQSQIQEYFQPQQQRASLVQEYQNLLAASGIQGLDTDLLNMKNVIEGTEDDIRNEVVKAGGFATDSQVLVLTNARNKQLIKNYNNLLETRNSKEKYLDQMMNLTVQDRQEADRKFDQMMDIGFKMADYTQKMRQNAVDSYNRIADKMGYDALYNQAIASGDFDAVTRIEKTLGIVPGGLATLAKISSEEREKEAQKEELDIKLQEARIKTEALQQKKIESELAGGKDKILSVDDAIKLGVPYGTTEKQAANMQTKIGGDATTSPLEEKITLIDNIYQHPGLNSRVGPTSFGRTKLAMLDAFGSGQDFAGKVHQLTSGETLNYLTSLKAKGGTLGALNEKELETLRGAATQINNWEIEKDGRFIGEWDIDESSFKEELDRIKKLTVKALTNHLGYDPALLSDEDIKEVKNIFSNSGSTTMFNPASYY